MTNKVIRLRSVPASTNEQVRHRANQPHVACSVLPWKALPACGHRGPLPPQMGFVQSYPVRHGGPATVTARKKLTEAANRYKPDLLLGASGMLQLEVMPV